MLKNKINLFSSFIILLFSIAFSLFSAPPGPTANMVLPTPSGWGGCSRQTTNIVIKDIEGVNETTIRLEVDGVLYTWPNPVHFTWISDTLLIFTPSSPYPNNYLVQVTLLYVEDDGGTPSGPFTWNYRTDLDRPYFYSASRTPVPNSIINNAQPEISVIVKDSTSGIPLSGLCLCIDSYVLNCPLDRNSGYCWEATPFITYTDSTFRVNTSGLGLSFQNEDSVLVCLRKAVDAVPQKVSLCGPNWIDTLDPNLCWRFLVDRIGPRAILLYPNNRDTIACDTLVVRFVDYSGVDITSCRLRLDATLATESTNPYVNGFGDIVYYTGTGTANYYGEGNINVYVNSIRDVAGNQSSYFAGDFPLWTFTVDKTPPIASAPNPPAGGISSSASPVISVNLADAVSGVLVDSITFIVNGVPYRKATTPAITYVGTTATFNTAGAGLSWPDGSIINVCITAIDRVNRNRCGPNRLNPPYCWSFFVDLSGPQASIVSPPHGGWTACQYQQIKIWLFDNVGIQTSTIQLSVKGVTYYGLDHMTYSNDTLRFTPTVPFVDGDIVQVILSRALDGAGHDLPSPVSATFYVDRRPPSITSISPSPGSRVGATPTINIGLVDAGIGVNPSSAIMTVRGVPFNWPTYFTWASPTLSFNLGATGMSFAHGETLRLCLRISDNISPSFCGPNTCDSCWNIVFDKEGPVANMVYPTHNAITACASGRIKIRATDSGGVNFSTTRLTVKGTLYTWGSPRLSVVADTLIFTPSTPFAHGDTVDVILSQLDDSLGNPLSGAPRSWRFFIDTQPPAMVSVVPAPGGVTGDPTPLIRIRLTDTPAGVNPSSLRMTVGGVWFSFPHPALSWDGNFFSMDCGLAGLVFGGGDTVRVCMRNAGDLVSSSFCGPNARDINYCWTFTINLSGPIADLLRPLHMAYSACPLQQVVFSLTDPQGVIPESSSVSVNGVVYNWPSHLTWRRDSLIFTPSSPFVHGDTVQLSVIRARDSLFNELAGVYEWWFISDQRPPVIASITPPPGSYVSVASPNIEIMALDSVSGENPTTFSIRLEGVPYRGMLPWIWWLNPGFRLSTSTGGFSWLDGDTIDICVDSLADIVPAQYCGPNVMRTTTCWKYYVDRSNPQVRLIYPDSAVITACADSAIRIWLYDRSGIVNDSIRFWVGGTTYSLASPQLTYNRDTLRFVPPSPWAHGDTIFFRVSNAIDNAGNRLTGAPTWMFIVDKRPPQLVSISPAPGTVLTNPSPTFIFRWTDFPAGVDSATIRITLNGIPRSFPSAGMSWNPTLRELTYNLASAGLSFGPTPLTVCARVSDKVRAQWCGPNAGTDTCFIYNFDLMGPVATPIDPSPGEITACNMVQIRIRLTDDVGIQRDSIVLTVNGTPYRLSSPQLNYIGDSLLIFTPSAPYPEGTVSVVLRAFDVSGNALSGGSLSYSFMLDISPPVLSGRNPAPGAVISTTTPIISFTLTDVPAGVNPLSIVFDVAGEIARVGDAGVTWAGGVFTLNSTTFGLTLRDGDSVRCCVTAADRPDSCGPNVLGPSCWTFHINMSGPRAGIIRPTNWQTTSCRNQQITLWVVDRNGVDPASIRLRVNGVEYSVSDPQLSYDGDSILTFTPSVLWNHLDTILVQLTSANDIFGSALTTPLTWRFIIDTQPPVVVSFSPPSGFSMSSADTFFKIVITDFPAGVNRSSLELRVGAVHYYFPHPGMSWLGDTLQFRLSGLGYIPRDGETLRVCINRISDAVNLCAPNALVSPVCATYYYDFLGPYARVFSPPGSSWSSCRLQPIQIYLYDPNGVNLSTIDLSIAGIRYYWPNPCLTYSSPYLTFTPPFPWPEGTMLLIELVRADDNLGNPLRDAPVRSFFGIDTLPPVVVSTVPAPGSVVSPSITGLSATIVDASSGIFGDLLTLTIRGRSYRIGSPALSWDGSILNLNFSSAGITLRDGDLVRVCIDSIYDNAILCGMNKMPNFCWDFYVDGNGPTASMIWPPAGSYVACPRESILIAFNDPSGIDFDSLRFSINGIDFTATSPGVTIVNDTTIKYTPPVPFGDASTVFVRVLQIADTIGHTSGAGPMWTFFMDLSRPIADMFYPAPMSRTALDSVSVRLRDLISGLDLSTVRLVVAGFGSFSLSHPSLSYVDPYLVFEPSLAGFFPADGDTVRICISASDRAFVCGPNVMPDTCWRFIVDNGGPRAILISPPSRTITSCPRLGVRFSITDPSGIIPASIVLRVNGILRGTTSPGVSWAPPILTYTPPSPLGHLDTLRVSVVSARDSIGNAMRASDSVWTFYIVDIEPPILSGPFPPDGGSSSDPFQHIWIDALDSPAGVNPASVTITVNGTPYSFGSAGLYWDGDELNFEPMLADISFFDGETVRVCVTMLSDKPDTCAPNSIASPYCWSFIVNTAGPIARIGHPRANRWVACGPGAQSITTIIKDPDGVRADSIRFSVEGIIYRVSDPELSYLDTILTFIPSVPWSDGDTIDVSLLYAEDMLGNGLVSPLSWRFFVDRNAPFASSPYPLPGSTVGSLDRISIDIIDRGSGVDISSVIISINGVDYTSSSGIVWMGSTAVIYRDSILTTLTDTVVVCAIRALDRPHYCEPNAMSPPFCWSFVIDNNGPVAHPIAPRAGQWISCRGADQRFSIFLRDENGILTDSISVRVNGVLYRYSSGRMTFSDTMLVFTPSIYWSNGDTVRVRLVSAPDSLGNPALPLIYSFYMDMTPPVFWGMSPPAGGTASGSSPRVSVKIADFGAGLDTSSISFRIRSIDYRIGISPAVGWRASDSTAFIDFAVLGLSFSPGDTLSICASASDKPAMCEPNDTSICWRFGFSFDERGPIAILVAPDTTACSACTLQGFTALLSDVSGIAESTIVFRVNGIPYTIDSAGVAFDPLSGLLTFVPSAPWRDRNIMSVDSFYVADHIGNMGNDLLSLSIPIDLSPPIINVVSPSPGGVSSRATPIILFRVWDEGCGVNWSSLRFRVGTKVLTTDSIGVHIIGDTIRFNCGESGIYFVDGDTVRVCVLGVSDAATVCTPNSILSPICWWFIVRTSGPTAEAISPLPGEWIACDSSNQEIRLFLADPDGIADRTILLVVNGIPYTTDSTQLTYYPSTYNLRYIPRIPWPNGTVVNVTLFSAEDTLGNGLAMPLTYSFRVDLRPPEITFVRPVIGLAIHPGIARVSVGLRDLGAGIVDSSLGISVNGIWHNIGDPGVTWVGESLTYDGTSLGDTLFAAETVSVCVRGFDATSLCGPNRMNICWEYITTANGPYALPRTPLPGEVTSCNDSVMSFFLMDIEGDPLRRHTIRVSITIDSTVIIYGFPWLIYNPTDSVLTINYYAFSHGDTVTMTIIQAEDVYGSPLAAPLSVTFFVDLEGPIIISGSPRLGGMTAPGTPNIRFLCSDIPAGLDHSFGSITIGSYVYSIGSGALWRGDTLILPGASYSADTSFEDGDSIVLTITLRDSALYCGKNESVIEWWFKVGATPPTATIISPLEGAISSCASGNIKILFEDADGILYDSSGIIVNGASFDGTRPEVIFRGDTLIFNSATSFAHGDTVIFSPFAFDIYMSPLAEVETSFFVIDIFPPFASNYVPMPMSAILDWQAPISLDLADNPAGVDFAQLFMTLTTPRWARIFSQDSLATTWDGTTFRLDVPSYNGGAPWSPALDNSLIFWHERETVSVSIRTADNACCCGPNVSIYSWSFVILDDDSVGPSYANFIPTSIWTGMLFDVRVDISDPSGIYDDATGPGGQGIYLVWDRDGSLSNGGENIVTMRLESGNTFITDSQIGPFFAGDSPVYCVVAHDNDFDFLKPEDRAVSFGDTILPELFIAQGPTARMVFPENNAFTSCVDGQIIIILSDPDGVQPATIKLVVDGDTFSIGARMIYSNDSLIWTPILPFDNGQTVSVSLISAEDALGFGLDSVYRWSFTIDTEPPTISVEPFDSIISSITGARLEWVISDDGAGVDESSIVILASGVEYRTGNPGVVYIGSRLTLNFALAGINIPSDYALEICVGACDLARYCGANCSDTSCVSIRMSKKIDCNAWPIPFTPNNDGANDVVWFEYPDMEISGATIEVFDFDGRRVFMAEIPPTSQGTRALWNGVRDNNIKAIPGTYIYIILRDGKVVCKGTIVLAR